MDNITLNEQQLEAKDKIINWWKNQREEKQYFILAGYAGTGKTFLAKYITTHYLDVPEEKIAFIAPTGKAASVLIQRGAYNATTIHKLIYNRVETEYENEINGKIIKTKKAEFIKKPSIPNYKIIILDEVSMVDEKIFKDLISFGIPMICLGDNAQLPAIGRSTNLLDHPDFQLTQIVRQEENNSIIKIATMARNGQEIPTGNYGNVLVLNKNLLTEEQMKKLLLGADQILAGTNRTCRKINQQIKGYLGLDKSKLNIGEKLICLCNNWDVELDEIGNYSLVNGIIGNVMKTEIVDEEEQLGKMTFKPDFLEDETKGLIFDNNVFENGEFKYEFHQQVYIMDDGSYQVKQPFIGKQSGESNSKYRERLRSYIIQKRDALFAEQINFFQDAYCISVHKSQGSEWDNVVLFDEKFIFSESNNWLYTGITRAKKNLVIIK